MAEQELAAMRDEELEAHMHALLDEMIALTDALPDHTSTQSTLGELDG